MFTYWKGGISGFLPEVKNIYEGIQLWEEYTDKAFSLNREFKENILHIRYETF